MAITFYNSGYDIDWKFSYIRPYIIQNQFWFVFISILKGTEWFFQFPKNAFKIKSA